MHALTGVLTFLDTLNPAAARAVGRRLREGASSLSSLPHRYRGHGRGHGLRSMPVAGTPYIIIYCIEEERGIVRILAVKHGHQDQA